MVQVKEKKYNNYYYLRLEDDNAKNLIGRCCVETLYRENILVLWSLMVQENFRCKGYGTQLIKEAVSYYEKFRKRYKSNRSLVLYVYKNNTDAIRLYERNGFEICGDYYNDAYVMKYVPSKAGV